MTELTVHQLNGNEVEAIKNRMVQSIGHAKRVDIEAACLLTYCVVSAGCEAYDPLSKDDRVALLVIKAMSLMAKLVVEIGDMPRTEVTKGLFATTTRPDLPLA